MKNILKKFVCGLALVAGLGGMAQAANNGSYYPAPNPVLASWQGTNTIVSTNNPPWSTNTTLALTNGLYSTSILGGTTETNYVLLNPAQAGNTLSLTFQAQATVGGALFNVAGAGSNVVFTLYTVANTYPLVLGYNTNNGAAYPALSGTFNTNNNLYQSVTLTPFQTVSLALGTGTNIATTNIVVNENTTPWYFGNGVRVYLGSIQANFTNTAYLTNFAVYQSSY